MSTDKFGDVFVSCALQSKKCLREMLFIDLDVIYNDQQVRFMNRSLVMPIVFFTHLLRYVSFTVFRDAHAIGDHLDFYSKPKIFWLAAFVCSLFSFLTI